MAGATFKIPPKTPTDSSIFEIHGEIFNRHSMVSTIDFIEGRYISNCSSVQLQPLIKGRSHSIVHEKDLFDYIKRQEYLLERLESKLVGLEDLNRNISVLTELYIFRRPGEVCNFLREVPSVISLITETHRKIQEYFPEEEIFIEVLTDPSSLNENELLISISTNLLPHDAIKKLDAFDENWWLSASNGLQVDICVKVEYR